MIGVAESWKKNLHLFSVGAGGRYVPLDQWRTQKFLSGGQRERGLGPVALLSGIPLYLQMSETRILIRLLRIYFSRNWEFGSAL
jgi:hypothetical protein